MENNSFTKESLVAKLEALLGTEKAKEVFDKHFASKFPKDANAAPVKDK